MIAGLPISGSDLGEIASKGSPTILRMAARVFGLGTAEQDALTKGQFPGWLWLILGGAAGAYLGVQAQKKYPHQVNKVLSFGGGK